MSFILSDGWKISVIIKFSIKKIYPDVWRTLYPDRGKMKPQIKGQTNQWPKEKGQKYKKKRSTRPAAELWKMKFNAPIEHTPILYINVKRKMGTFKLMMP